MFERSMFEMVCPRCYGSGTEDTHEWRKWKIKIFMRAREILSSQEPHKQDFYNAVKRAEGELIRSKPEEVKREQNCLQCHGKGTVLTDEGKALIEFVREWM